MSEDIYSDLIESTGASGATTVHTQNKALSERVKLREAEIFLLESRLRGSEESRAHLREENSRLERNISCLYRTAIMVFAPHYPVQS
jgi:hypothetical protein